MTTSSNARLVHAEYRSTEDGLAISVDIQNEGKRTVLVGCGIRQIQFDKDTGSLSVWFSDHGRDPSAPHARCRMNTAPRTVEAKAGERVQVRGRVPRELRRLMGVKGSEVVFDVFDVSEVRDVEVHVVVAEAPFYFNPSKGSAVEQLKSWGEDLHMEVRPSRRDSGDSKDESTLA